jgi:uncharacterized membrane protein YccC
MGKRWAAVTGWLAGHPSEFRLGLRMLIAGMTAFFIADVLLGLPQSYWSVLTAVIVMQASVGGALKASFDRIVGTFAGAVWGVFVALAVPHGGSWLLAAALTLALAPLALLVAFKPAYRVAPVTAIIVLLGATSQVAGPVMPALHRVLEIGIGSLVGLVVALLVLPARANRLLADQAATVLAIQAQQIEQVPARLTGTADDAVWQNLASRRRKGQEKVETLADEAKRERRNRLTDAPDPEPLARTLRRLGQDMATIGRVTSLPCDASLIERLSGPTTDLARAIAHFLESCGAALTQREAPPPIGPLATALDAYGETVADLRRDGLTRPLSGPAIERLFGLGFALDQLRRDAEDLAERVAELAPAAASEAVPAQ